MYRNGPEWASITGMDRNSKECTVIDRNGINNRNGQFLPFKCRVKPGFIGRQGSSDRSLYVSYTALPTDTSLERSYPFVLATNLLSDTAVTICIARVITLCSHWIKHSSEKTRLVLKGVLQNGAEKNIEIRHRSTLTSCPRVFTLNLWLKLFF